MTKAQVQSVLLSFVIHIIFVVLYAGIQLTQRSLNIRAIEPQAKKVIKSYLYVAPVSVKLGEKRSVMNNVQQHITLPKHPKITASKTQAKNKLKQNVSNPFKEKPKEIIIANRNALQSSKNEKSLPQKIPIPKNPQKIVNKTVLAAKALKQLQKKISASIIEESSKEYIKQRMADKNKIDRSIASLRKKPEITTTQVDCASDFNNNLVAISSILGGNLSSKKPPDIDKFIDARLESRGVKKKK